MNWGSGCAGFHNFNRDFILASLRSMIVDIFLSIFILKYIKLIFFYFLKIIFDNSILKWSKNTKKY
jgi:hypothetical protein